MRSESVLPEVLKLLDENMRVRCALQLIATPQRPDGTWNRDREACRILAEEALKHERHRT